MILFLIMLREYLSLHFCQYIRGLCIFLCLIECCFYYFYTLNLHIDLEIEKHDTF